MIILDMALRMSPTVRVFTLDTGRLPEETFAMIDAVRLRYGVAVEIVSPDATELARMTAQHGPNLFRDDPSLRKLCCHIRKTLPLQRKLADFDAWAVGLRRSQSDERADIARIDRSSRAVKLSPLADWSAGQVEQYLHDHDVPRHPLYSAGYGTIGCQPCSRPIAPGEDLRSGRWWWEQDDSKECGIHVTAEGQFRRKLDVLVEDILVH